MRTSAQIALQISDAAGIGVRKRAMYCPRSVTGRIAASNKRYLVASKQIVEIHD